MLLGYVYFTEHATVYVAVCATVYATFVILKESVRATGALPQGFPS